VGFPGQIAMAGVGVGRGYLGAPGQTAAAFVPDPRGEAGGRLYLSGDRGRWTNAGTLEVLGRLDFQVKLHGQRVELGEVEAALSRHPAVRQAVAVVRPDGRGRERLVGYWVGDPVGTADLRAFLRQSLPRTMLPAALVHLAAMPLTRNGKIDRRALPEPRREAFGPQFHGLRDSIEMAVAALWEEELGVTAVSVVDDFFELGGNSLHALSLATRLLARFGFSPPLRALLEAPTVAGFSRLVRERLRGGERGERDGAAPGRLVALQEGDPAQPRLFMVHPHLGAVFSYHSLARALGPRWPVFGLQARGLEEGEEPYDRIPEMAAAYCREVRALQPHGPYHLGGWSFGVRVAFEMARELERGGDEVAFLGVLDDVLEDPQFPNIEDTGEPEDAVILSLLAQEMYGSDQGQLRGLGAEQVRGLVIQGQRELGIVPQDADEARLHRLFAVMRAHLVGYLHYRPSGPVRTDVWLFRASEESRVPDPAVWQPWTRGRVRLIPVAGNHDTIVFPPGVHDIANALRALQEGAREASAVAALSGAGRR
jgi:thioesterase domain-containing protein/acyl carrier protein